jgi:hypothetical protein
VLVGVFSPAVLGPIVVLALASIYALLRHAGIAQASIGRGVPGLRRALLPDPAAALALLHADPATGVLRLLAPALLQAVIFALLLTLVFFLVRRLRPAPASGTEDHHTFAS